MGSSREDSVRDVSQAYKLYVTICIFMVVLVFTTLLRIFARLMYRGTFTVDDAFIALGTVLLLLKSGTSSY